ncbi:hypothetical protein [Sanguibacter antarcticus]|uniref:hypothetical protein n=1 Tax=Sanguibacter antarcticus TaxID=372484 RepID=UPI00117B776D|nr:hypothetical protein [Sanguibacter antarcticus]
MSTPSTSVRAPRAARGLHALRSALGAVALAGLLSGCTGPDPLTPLEDGDAPQADADRQAHRLELVLENLELRYAVSDTSNPPHLLAPFVPAEQAALALTEQLALGNQAQAYVSAHAAYLDDELAGTDRPDDVDVVVDDVTVLGSAAGDPVARVSVVTTYGFDDAPSTTTTTEYAISWSSRSVTADGSPASSPGDDEVDDPGAVRLEAVYPLYEDGGRPALDSGEGTGSASNAVHDYLRAVTYGSSRDVDALEGSIRTSDELREVLKEELAASPRYTPVEIPAARAGNEHVLYVVPATGAQALRLDVTLTDAGPTVVPRL